MGFDCGMRIRGGDVGLRFHGAEDISWDGVSRRFFVIVDVKVLLCEFVNVERREKREWVPLCYQAL